MPEWVLQLLALVCGSAGVYAAIRADMAYLRARVDSAHDRIDDMLGKRRSRAQ